MFSLLAYWIGGAGNQTTAPPSYTSLQAVSERFLVAGVDDETFKSARTVSESFVVADVDDEIFRGEHE